MAQNIDFSGSDHIQTPQYPDVHLPSQEKSKKVSQTKEDLMKSIQTFLEKFNCISFEEKPPILLQAWFKFFAIQYSNPENPNELFQKLLKDLKELADYKKSQSRDRPIFLNDDSDQNKECFENSSDEIDASNPNQEKEEPPQDSDIHQLIEECSIKFCEEQKQIMEYMMLELVKICQEKEFLCIHDNVDDLVESTLNSKLLSINSQHLDKKEQEVKNVVEQPAERGNRTESLQNFRVIHKSSISLNTSQISSIHAVAAILSTKEPEYSPSMGYENSNTTMETELYEIIKSGVEELVPILNENEFLFIHDDVNNLIESSLESKLLSINSINSQRHDKKEQEVKNVEEQPAERRNHAEREIILRQDKQSLTIQCGDTPSIKKFEQINKIDFIDAGKSDSEEIENFLNDDSILIEVENSKFNMEEDILFLERLLSEDPSLPPTIPNQTKSSIKEPEHSFSMGYEHFSTTLVTNEVTESSTKNLIPIPHECEVTSDNGSRSIEPVKDDSSVFMTISNTLFDNDEINSDELESHVESNFVESISNHDTVKIDNLDEFSGPLIPIHIAEEERIRREHADFINQMEMLFTINPHLHPTVNANTNVESLPSLPISVQDNDSQREEIDIITSTDDVLPPGVENDDSDGEVDAIDDLHVDNSISNSEHEFSESEESIFDNPSVPLPPPEPPDKEFDFEIDFGDEILVVRNTIVEFECIDARVKFDVSNDENDDYSYFMFAKVFSFLFAESEDTIFDPGISV
nr:hypothetical protein [Tanacetum cinerariifolium]